MAVVPITERVDVRRQPGEVLPYKMAAVKIFEGALVSVNAAGYLTNATDTASDIFAGVADETVDNSAGNAGDKEMKVRIGGVVNVDSEFSAAQTNVTDLVYAYDNHTVSNAATMTNDVLVGRIVEVVSASKLRVALVTPGRA